MIEDLVANAPSYLLVAARCFALIMTIPLLSTRAVSASQSTLAGYIAYIAYPLAYVKYGKLNNTSLLWVYLTVPFLSSIFFTHR